MQREIVRSAGFERRFQIEVRSNPSSTRSSPEVPDKADAYRGGKTGLLGFFVGQLMRETKGQANPQLAQELVKEKLG